MPKRNGGLSFLDLESFNLALLCKQGWRIIKNPISLLSRVMQAKYFPLVEFSSATLGYRPSYIWRSILTPKPYLLQQIRSRIDNGHSVNIWGDKWLTTPHLFKLSSPKHLIAFDRILKVFQLIDFERGVWKHELIQQYFSSYEAEEIFEVPLYDAWPRDEQVWLNTPTG